MIDQDKINKQNKYLHDLFTRDHLKYGGERNKRQSGTVACRMCGFSDIPELMFTDESGRWHYCPRCQDKIEKLKADKSNDQPGT